MGVYRTDYLMFGVRVDPEEVSNRYEEFEAEIDGAPGRKFDLIYDGMSGKYAVAGKIIARSDPYEGLEFKEIAPADMAWDAELMSRIRGSFPEASGLALILFSHFH